MDEVARANEQVWEGLVKEGDCGYTIPWLDLKREEILKYAEGSQSIPPQLRDIYPAQILSSVKDRKVLCLASGGGQQSVVFGLLGANVTVVDLTQGQLDGDIQAAGHYGYDVTTIKADMRDLSSLDADTFDLVYQGNSIAYVPDARQVFAQVLPVLKRGGRYRADFQQSAVGAVEWNGSAYCVARPYAEKVYHREDGGIEFRHNLGDIFSGLIETGFAIEGVYDRPQPEHAKSVPPGSWSHQEIFVGGEFAVVARKT